MTEEIDSGEEIVEEIIADDESEVVTPEPKVREWTDEEAEQAKEFGWKSPDEWVGEVPAGYIDDPRRYLERADNFKPFKALKQKLAEAETNFTTRISKLESISAKALEAQKAQVQRELDAIHEQQRQAVSEADTDRFDDLEKRKRELSKSDVAPQDGPHEYVAEYAKTNKWVNDPALRSIGAQLIDGAGMRGAPVEAQIRFAEQEIKRLYPHMFEAPKTETPKPKPAPQRVDAGGLGGGTKASPFSKLPPEARTAFNRFVAEGIFENTEADKKRYADDYDAA